ncbi:MAG: hypothetical protein WAW37_02985 [Syntrophobacteraceae bacterium]
MESAKPRVLAISDDKFALRQIRLEMPLLNLKKHGLIEDYVITDYRFKTLRDDYLFDTVWLQRVVPIDYMDHLKRALNDNFIFDIDDLLIGKPTYTRGLPKNSGAREALDRCKVLACTTQRLVGVLEKYAAADLAHKAVICPNGFEFSKGLRTPEKPAGLVWTSSDYPALIGSRDAVINAIETFSQKYGLPVYCFGTLTDAVTSRIRNIIELGMVSFWHHKALLGSFPPLIGVAPLETVARPEDLEFIHAKSDVKMVEFGGFGHPSVYSNAPPYVDTDLRCGTLVENDESSWLEALEASYSEKWKNLDKEQAGVVEARNMDRIAQKWCEALSRGRLDHCLPGIVMKTRFSARIRRIFAGL